MKHCFAIFLTIATPLLLPSCMTPLDASETEQPAETGASNFEQFCSENPQDPTCVFCQQNPESCSEGAPPSECEQGDSQTGCQNEPDSLAEFCAQNPQDEFCQYCQQNPSAPDCQESAPGESAPNCQRRWIPPELPPRTPSRTTAPSK